MKITKNNQIIVPNNKSKCFDIKFKGKEEIPEKLFQIFPQINPFKTHKLQVSKIHQLHIEEYGNPNGIPAIYLHGGPGYGTTADDARSFNPDLYHIILADQRGAGKSTPYACLKNNTTRHLVADIEKIKNYLNIKNWLVVGQSWGSTLALAYAEKHPKSVSGLILQGVFMGRPEEIKWLRVRGANQIFPEQWDKFISILPANFKKNVLKGYKKLLTSKDENVRKKAAGAWNSWEGFLLKKDPDSKYIEEFGDPALALFENTFERKKLFLKKNELLKNAGNIKQIPTWIIEGECDWVCPPKTARDLYNVLPNSKLMKIPNSGHSFTEPRIASAYVQAVEEYRLMKENPKLNFLI